MAAVVLPSVNGVAAPPSNNIDEILEYEKILRLRDEIFAGSHPRLTVPAHAIRKVSPRVLQAPAQPPTAILPPLPSDTSNGKLPGLLMNGIRAQPTSTTPKVNGFPAMPPPLPKPAPPQASISEIDPVLLTKSDDLVRAETQLQRQRLERSLKEQFEQKKAEARRRPAPQEAKPDFDVAIVLARALEVAKPDPSAKPSSPNDGASATDSFDENSFYSSKAPDSTPEDGARTRQSPPSKHQVQPMNVDDLDADGVADQRGRRMQQLDMTDSPYKVNPRPDYNASSGSRPPYPSWQDRPPHQGPNTVDLTAMDLDDDDEPEYSPPEPVEQYPLSAPNGPSPFNNREPIRRPLRRYSEIDQEGKRYALPSEADMRIVRNHITSPVAPQPSRVSPLAVAKAPPMSQNPRFRKDRNRQQQTGRPDSPRSSPEPIVQPLHPRKKRKLDRKAEKKTMRRHGAVSPETYIKEEPVSPPPFHDKQPLGAARSRPVAVNRPIYVDDTPIQEVRYMPTAERYVEVSPRQAIYETEPGMPRSEPRPYSRSGMMPLGREDQDLRKVASMHSLRAEQPRDYTEPIYETPSRTRAASYAIVERPVHPDQPTVYHESMRDERVMRSPVPGFRDPDTGVRYERQSMMPPPQRRIVLDEFGNQIVYEMVQSQRASVAPRSTRPTDPETYHDFAFARNRASSVYAEPVPEKRYVQEMAPPQVTYRRFPETSRTSAVEQRPVQREQLESSQIQRSSSVQVVDYPTRQPVYIDERMEPREARVSSVRPPTLRYEEVQPREAIQRVQSVRPVAREESVFIDDRPQVRREYIPVEQPRYRTVMQDGRYYEVQDRETIVLDGAEEARPRLVQRY